MARKPNTKKIDKERPWHFAWRWHDTSEIARRVWRTDWFGDQFEILGPDNFVDLERVCKRFAISMIDMNDED
jgi:hypothetical protein